ncbi:MAG TPA: class I SAM-dependent methyltransferase [Anaerolineales bacterium]|nr:class I SAM-dependent methyltransferase [Anaerolineales bacterium]
MPDSKTVYARHGDEYEALIAREDYQENILSALQSITSLENRVVLDLGAGTGRLTCMLAPLVSHVYAFDIAPDMLRVCREKLTESGLSNWAINIADHRQLPIADHSADLVVSGWSVSYLAVWNPESWQTELEKALSEMKRVLKGGSYIVLFESLGTGNESPIKLDHLKNFYLWLEEVGFQKKWIRTDYQFESLEEAEYLSRFFFGDELGDKVKQNNWVILPECTGVWWMRV